MDKRLPRRRILFSLAWLLALGLLALVLRLSGGELLGADDFVAYWAAGRLNLSGDNPYSVALLQSLQRQVGWIGQTPLMAWNPPWTLAFFMPFGSLEYHTSRVLWFVLTLVTVLICSDLLWTLYGGSPRQRWAAWVLGACFMPTLFTLRIGQISGLVLLGITGFLWSVKRQAWALAGVTAFPLTVKPHISYLFWLAFPFWILTQKRWRALFGCGLTGLLALAIAVVFNPRVVAQYWSLLTSGSLLVCGSPTFGSVVRLVFGVEKYWLQFLPSLLGMVWFILYCQKHRRAWDWQDQMPLLLLVSLATACFGWEMDQIVLLPAVLQAGVWICHSPRKLAFSLGALVYGAANVLALILNLRRVHPFWYFWMAPAFLLSYLTLSQAARRTEAEA